MLLVCNNFELRCFLSAILNSHGVNGGYGVVGGCFTDIVLHSSINHHHEHATQSCRLHKDVAAAFGAVTVRFHGFSNLVKSIQRWIEGGKFVCDRL